MTRFNAGRWLRAPRAGQQLPATAAYATAQALQTVLDMGMEEGPRSAVGQLDALLAA